MIDTTEEKIKNIFRNKKNIYTMLLVAALLAVSVLAYLFVSSDEAFYKKPIAKVLSVTEAYDHQTRKRFVNKPSRRLS